MDMDDVRPEQGEFFAWCFDHGRLHRFSPEPWCTAAWIRLDGQTESQALASKTALFGDARFIDQLSPGSQVELVNISRLRRTKG
jgi:hypothetical protein